MTGPYYFREAAKEAAAYVEDALLDAYTADSVSIPAVGSTTTITNLNNGEAFSLQSTWIIAHTADASIWFEFEAIGVNGTSVEARCLRRSGSATKSGWSASRMAPPKKLVDFNAKIGLSISRATGDPANDITVTPGTIRDSTDTVNITLSSALTKQFDAVWAAGTNQGVYVLSSNLSGTIAQSASTAITGTSTLFITDVLQDTPANVNYDWNARGTGTYFDSSAWGGTSTGYNLITRSGSSTPVKVTGVTTNTAATAAASATYSGETFKRGGNATLLASASGTVEFALCLGLKSTDGSVDVFATTINVLGAIDYPSGYDYFAILALVEVGSGGIKTIRPAMLDGKWFTETKATTSGTTVDFVVDNRANEVSISFNGVSTDTGSRDLRIQALTAAATPDSTAGNYLAFGVTNSTSPAAAANSVASFIATAATNAAGSTITGAVRISGIKEFAGKAVPFDASWYSSATAGDRGAQTGFWTNGTQMYGIRALISGSGNFDAGSITVSYR